MADCLVSVDLGLNNPDMKMPPEIGSLLYVACTRVTKLENLFVSPIHLCLWQKIGQTDNDKHRRMVDAKLRKNAATFSEDKGKYQETLDELSWTSDCSNNDEKWRMLKERKDPPQSAKQRLSKAKSKLSIASVQSNDVEPQPSDVELSDDASVNCTPLSQEYRDFDVVLGDIKFAMI